MKKTTSTPTPTATDMNPTIATTSADSLAEQLLHAGRQLALVQQVKGVAPFILVPNGFELQYPKEEVLPTLPDHIRQRVRLDDAASFVAYVKLYKNHLTRLFATAPKLEELIRGSAGGLQFTALLDYHQTGKEQAAARSAHIASYPVPLSLEIRTWLASNGKPLSQMDFVNFIEANCVDVVTPSSADLMELALNFEAKSEVQFASKVDRVTGGRTLKFTETVDASSSRGETSGQIKVPEVMSIRVPLFEGGKAYEMSARLEYRPQGGKLTIAYHLQRPQVAFREALKDLRSEIEHDTELQVLTGEASRPD